MIWYMDEKYTAARRMNKHIFVMYAMYVWALPQPKFLYREAR